jgi:hypothetical protein
MVAIRYRIETLMDAAPSVAGASVSILAHGEPDLAR